MRRTKEQAALTREAIVDAALACFDRHGIGSSTLEQIACAAGVTKGAIYHHFEGKREILRAIREQVSLPLLDEADTALLRGRSPAPLERVQRFLLGILETLSNDARKRRALAVMHFRCEYVGELRRELAAAARNIEPLAKALEGVYRQAHAQGQLREGLLPSIAALETVIFMNGFIRLWLLQGSRGAIRRHARAAVLAHVESRRAPHATSAA